MCVAPLCGNQNALLCRLWWLPLLPRCLRPPEAQHHFGSGKQPFSSWITLWRRCEYALINLNSHRKRPGTTGSLRINLNSSFMSLTQTQMYPSTVRHAEGCPATGLCSPVIAPVMLSCSFYRNPNGLFKQQREKVKKERKFHLPRVCPLPDSQDKRAGSWEDGNTNMHPCLAAQAHWLIYLNAGWWWGAWGGAHWRRWCMQGAVFIARNASHRQPWSTLCPGLHDNIGFRVR